ncbi:MAG: hypothetical protein ACOX8S_11050 [Christensenellales bacterium]
MFVGKAKDAPKEERAYLNSLDVNLNNAAVVRVEHFADPNNPDMIKKSTVLAIANLAVLNELEYLMVLSYYDEDISKEAYRSTSVYIGGNYTLARMASRYTVQ